MSGDQNDSDEDSVDGERSEGEVGEPPQQGADDTEPSQGGDAGQPQGQPLQGGAASPPGGTTGGQPQGQPQGQPPAQQPQGGYQQGGARQPVQTGPSVGDIFSRLETLNEMKVGVAVFAFIGVGAGLAVVLSGLTVSLAAGAFFIIALASGSLAVSPAIGGLIAIRQVNQLEDTPDNLVYANAAVTGLGGTIVLGIIITISAAIGAGGGGGGGSSGQFFIGLIFVAIGTAAASAGAAWAALNLPSDSRGPPRAAPDRGGGTPPQGGQGQPPQGGQGQPPQGGQTIGGQSQDSQPEGQQGGQGGQQ